MPWGGKNYNHTTAKNLSEVTAVSSRYDESSRRVATEEYKRRTRIPTDGDRCVFETGLVYSAEEQVGCIPGDRLCVVTRQYSADHFANDKGSEFLNTAFQKLLKEYGVHHFATQNEETKASIVERFNGTLNTRMWRYFTKKQSVQYVDVLQDFIRSYNNRFHRTIGMAPSEVKATNQEEVWQRLYGYESVGIPKYRVGDCVRISKAAVQERLHGKLDRRVVYDRRRAPFGATGLPPGGLARRMFGGYLLRTCVRAYGGRACVRHLTIPHAWPTCVRSLVCVCSVRACSRVYDAACVAVLHVHSRMCVNILRAYVDVVIRVRAVPSIFHASFSRLFACSGPRIFSPYQCSWHGLL